MAGWSTNPVIQSTLEHGRKTGEVDMECMTTAPSEFEMPLSNNIVLRETFEGENFRVFRRFVAIRKSFLREIWGVAFFGATQASNP